MSLSRTVLKMAWFEGTLPTVTFFSSLFQFLEKRFSQSFQAVKNNRYSSSEKVVKTQKVHFRILLVTLRKHFSAKS